MSTSRAFRLSSLAAALLLFAMFCLLIFYAGVVIWLMNSGTYTGQSYPIDFAVFWGAAKLALDGNAAGAFDRDTLYAAMAFPPEYEQPKHFWRYPPTWHLMIAPLGALPFTAAWSVFNLISIGLLIRALSPVVDVLPGRLSLILAAPTILFGILTANNGILFCAVLIFALQALERGDQRAAGLILAILSVKPQIAVLVPVALACAGYWRAMLWGAIGTVGLAALATLVFGFGYWQAFFGGLGDTADALAQPSELYGTLTTWTGFLRAQAVPESVVFWGGILVLIVGAIMVGIVWAGRAPFRAKAGLLLIAVPVISPYAHYYEAVYPLAGIVLLLTAGGMRRWWMWLPVLVIYVMPGVVPYLRQPPVFLWTMAPALTAVLLIALAEARRLARL